MDFDLEKKVINSFVYKEFRDRLYFELTNNRRNEFIHKFCKEYTKYIRNQLIYFESNRHPSYEDIKLKFKEYNALDKIYIITDDEKYDGSYIDLKIATQDFGMFGFATFIIGLPSGFTFFKGESFYGYWPNFYLKPNVRFDGKPWST